MQKTNTFNHYFLSIMDTCVHLDGVQGDFAVWRVGAREISSGFSRATMSISEIFCRKKAREWRNMFKVNSQGDRPLQDLPSLREHQQDHGAQHHPVFLGVHRLPLHPWVHLYQGGRRDQQVQDYPRGGGHNIHEMKPWNSLSYFTEPKDICASLNNFK